MLLINFFYFYTNKSVDYRNFKRVYFLHPPRIRTRCSKLLGDNEKAKSNQICKFQTQILFDVADADKQNVEKPRSK